MSLPEPHSNPEQATDAVNPLANTTDWLPQPRPKGTACQTRTARVTAWAGGHFGELVGTGGPLLLAFTVSGWFAVASGAAAAWWASAAHRARKTPTTAAPQVAAQADQKANEQGEQS